MVHGLHSQMVDLARSICVHLQEMGLDLSERNLTETMCDEVDTGLSACWVSYNSAADNKCSLDWA